MKRRRFAAALTMVLIAEAGLVTSTNLPLWICSYSRCQITHSGCKWMVLTSYVHHYQHSSGSLLNSLVVRSPTVRRTQPLHCLSKDMPPLWTILDSNLAGSQIAQVSLSRIFLDRVAGRMLSKHCDPWFLPAKQVSQYPPSIDGFFTLSAM